MKSLVFLCTVVNICDKMCEIPPSLFGGEKGSFAYRTIRDRLPVILAKVIDSAHRHRHEIGATFGEEGLESLKGAIHELSKLRYEQATDKAILPLNSKRSDVEIWNRELEEKKLILGKIPTWYSSSWLHVECYMYRKIAEIFENSGSLAHFDPFKTIKEAAFMGSLKDIQSQGRLLLHLLSQLPTMNQQDKKLSFFQLFQNSLWGNKYDLSISAMSEQSGVALPQFEDHHVLVNHSAEAYQELESGGGRVDIVQDNSGLELFNDLCLADFLLEVGWADVIHLHIKGIPWFVSDTTMEDLTWMFEMMRNYTSEELRKLGNKWSQREEDGSLQVKFDEFWNGPHSYDKMETVAPELYSDFAKAKLIIFKGDLNYRKLIGDLKWPYDADFADALRGFKPAPLVSLRTLKADTVAGLLPGVGEKLTKETGSRDWMTTGEYAVIQFNK